MPCTMKLLTRQRSSTAWLRHQIVRDRIWRIIDAKDQVLGRLAVQIARILQGKHKHTYFDNMNCGDPVIVINARHFALTGRKRFNKIYTHHTGYPGGLRQVPIRQVMRRRPTDALRLAVKSMLPSNKLRAVWLDNLRIYLDDEHDLTGVKPVPVPLAHCSKRIGAGGPPTYAELENWWTENLLHVPDELLSQVVGEVRAEQASANRNTVGAVGLAQALEFSQGTDPSPEEVEVRSRYITAAEESLKHDAVIVPTQFA